MTIALRCRRPRRPVLSPFLAAIAAMALLVSAAATAAEHPRIAKARAAERKSFSDAEIFEGFFKITFGAEYQVAGNSNRIRKYDGPVRVYIDNRAQPHPSKQAAAALADIKNRVQHLDIAITERRTEANVVVTLVRDRDLGQAMRAIYGRERARRIQKSLEPQCLSSFSKGEDFRITRSDVLLVTDVSDFIFYDCAYEEMLQALGPINDDSTVRWSMFNDRVNLGFFGVYDQYILNILYHPRIRPGMTRAEVRAELPQVMPEVRAFVAQRNNLPR